MSTLPLELNDQGRLKSLPRVTTRADQIRSLLSEAIAENHLDPSVLYSVQALADELGVSRTPVREALVQLARQGMVEFVRNRGVRVLVPSARDLEEIFQLRVWLEVPASAEAARLATAPSRERARHSFRALQRAAKAGDIAATLRWDRDFHRVILDCSGNRRVGDYIDSLRQIAQTQGFTTEHARPLVELAKSHEPILEAFLNGDAGRTAAAMKVHLEETASLLQTRLAGGGSLG